MSGLKKQTIRQTVFRMFESLRGRQFFPFLVDVPFDILAAEAPLVAVLVPLDRPSSGEIVDGIGAHVQKNGEVTRFEDVGKLFQSAEPSKTPF